MTKATCLVLSCSIQGGRQGVEGESPGWARTTFVGRTGVASLAAPAMLISATVFWHRAFLACRFNRTCYEFSAEGKIGLPISAHLGSSFTCVRASSPLSPLGSRCAGSGVSPSFRRTGIKKPRSDKRSNFPGRRKARKGPKKTNLYYLLPQGGPSLQKSCQGLRVLGPGVPSGFWLKQRGGF